MMEPRGFGRVILVAVLVAAAGLAGCAGDQAPTDDGDTAEGQAEARQTYAKATNVFTEPAGDNDRVSTEVTIGPADDPKASMHGLYDAEKALLVTTMEGAYAQGAAGGGAQQISEVTVGQVHKTLFFGAYDGLMGFYNASETPPTGFADIEASGGGQQGPSTAATDPGRLFENLVNASDEAESFRMSETTHEGEPAVEITATWTIEGESYEIRAVYLTEAERPALFEGKAPAGDGQTAFKVVFTYGEDATHPQEEAVHRAEAMTFAEGEPDLRGQQDTSPFTNRTIQPSQNPGMVALDEVQVLAVPSNTDRDPSQGLAPPALTLDAEAGSAQNENVTLTYEDADGDGAVTPGDRLVLEDRNTSDQATFRLELRDEQTDTRLAPSAGLLAGLLVLGAAAIARRRT